jgi:hypothetical protein
MSTRPAFAISPAMKVKVPLLISNCADGEAGWLAKSFTTMRPLSDKLNTVPSIKRMQTLPPDEVSMLSPWQTVSPSLI